MLAAADHLQHAPRLVDVFGLAQDLSIKFGNRIARDDCAGAVRGYELPRNVLRFLQSKTQDQLGRTFAATRATLIGRCWHENVVRETSLGQ